MKNNTNNLIDSDHLENQNNQHTHYNLEFLGNGKEWFKIIIINWLLTILTLGIYYPWARAKSLRYMYGKTVLNNEHFHFSGTGKEMFRGFIKVILGYVLLSVLIGVISLITPILAGVVLYLVVFLFIPFAIHGSFKYKMSRTSYRGIRFGYRGERKEFILNFIKWVFLTIITLGIYSFWLEMNVRKYTHENIRYGDVEFTNTSDGGDWFGVMFFGYIKTIFSFGIYVFWWQRDIFDYYINNIGMKKGDQIVKCHSTATGGDFFELIIGNLFIIIFSFGLGIAWVDIRTQKFIFEHIKMEGNINFSEISQTEEEYKDAFGEDAMDFFEIEI